MGGRAIAVVAAAAVALCALLPATATTAEPVNVSWTSFLPAMPGDPGGTGGPQPGCRKATVKCVTKVMRGLRKRQRAFGCDHRAVFSTTYLELTRVLRRVLRTEPKFYEDRRALIYLDVLFARVYFNTLARREAGKPVDEAWRIALDAAASGDQQGAGDMLLGINAHVQNDMPFVVAAIGLRDKKGRTRKIDHDRGNEVLNRAFEDVTREVARRFDPLTAWETYQLSPATHHFGIELVRTWREGVWRNAERLVQAKTDAERRRVADSIHAQAAATAESIRATTIGPPGYRAQRDAYCAAGPSGSGA